MTEAIHTHLSKPATEEPCTQLLKVVGFISVYLFSKEAVGGKPFFPQQTLLPTVCWLQRLAQLLRSHWGIEAEAAFFWLPSLTHGAN